MASKKVKLGVNSSNPKESRRYKILMHGAKVTDKKKAFQYQLSSLNKIKKKQKLKEFHMNIKDFFFKFFFPIKNFHNLKIQLKATTKLTIT